MALVGTVTPIQGPRHVRTSPNVMGRATGHGVADRYLSNQRLRNWNNFPVTTDSIMQIDSLILTSECVNGVAQPGRPR